MRRLVLLGASAFLILNAVLCSALVILDGDVDPRMAIPFAPDAFVGLFVWWLVRARQATWPAAVIYVAYMVFSTAIVLVQVGGVSVLGTPWPLLAPLLALYTGGRRLAAWTTGAMVVIAIGSFIVDQTGVGLTMMVLPSFDDAAGALLAGAGGLALVVLVYVHETSRVQTQRTLEAALVELDTKEQTLSTLVESATDIIILLDADYRILAANSAAQRLTREIGAGDVPLLGKNVLSIVNPKRHELWQARLEQCAQLGRVRVDDIFSNPTKDIHLETFLHRLVTDDRLVGYTMFMRDITERREAEAALQKLRGQLIEASRRAGRADVATGVLHNVGNVLNSVSVSADVIEAHSRDLHVPRLRRAVGVLAEHSEALEQVMGDRGGKLVDFLGLVVEEIESERQTLTREAKSLGERLEHIRVILHSQREHAGRHDVVEEIALDELVRSALSLDVGWRGSGIEMTCSIDPAATRIVCDRHKLLQILINLLRNARDAVSAIDDGARMVHVRVSAESGGHIRLTVSDTGMGIAPENRGDLFRHGFTTKVHGHGFGLHSSALLARDLGGDLTFDSAGLGQGATFTLVVPREPTGAPAADSNLAA